MIVVSNTTPLIGLAAIKRFALLHEFFGTIHIPQAVYNEIMDSEYVVGKNEVATASWIQTVQVTNQFAVEVLLDELDRGEAETIVLAHELQADWVLMDEKKGRRKLTQLGIPKVGTLGILLKAKQTGIVPTLRPELYALCTKGFSLSQRVIDDVLQQAGEELKRQ